jgi:hypothetical protein
MEPQRAQKGQAEFIGKRGIQSALEYCGRGNF